MNPSHVQIVFIPNASLRILAFFLELEWVPPFCIEALKIMDRVHGRISEDECSNLLRMISSTSRV
jgi:hypothetical protein